MGRPNRGTGSAGFKKSGNGGGKDQYSLGGSTTTTTKPSKTSKPTKK